MHYLMTYPEGEGFLQYIAALRNSKPGQFEVINLLEPHKLTQNSITIIRRTSGVVARRYAEPGGTLNYDEPLRAQAEMQAAAAATASVSGTVGSSGD
jgi:hypothetical protein